MIRRTLAALLTAACLLGVCVAAQPSKAPTPSGDPDSDALATFATRVKDYLALHRKLETQLPRLGKQATPEAIDKHERALGALLQAARRGAAQGEFFTPGMQSILRRLFEKVSAGTDGANLLGSIMDENPGELPKLAVGERYPDNVPLATMPSEVLGALPKLDEDMEYRFVGDRLVLLDAHAHLIVDFTDAVLPKRD